MKLRQWDDLNVNGAFLGMPKQEIEKVFGKPNRWVSLKGGQGQPGGQGWIYDKGGTGLSEEGYFEIRFDSKGNVAWLEGLSLWRRTHRIITSFNDLPGHAPEDVVREFGKPKEIYNKGWWVYQHEGEVLLINFVDFGEWISIMDVLLGTKEFGKSYLMAPAQFNLHQLQLPENGSTAH